MILRSDIHAPGPVRCNFPVECRAYRAAASNSGPSRLRRCTDTGYRRGRLQSLGIPLNQILLKLIVVRRRVENALAALMHDLLIDAESRLSPSGRQLALAVVNPPTVVVQI